MADLTKILTENQKQMLELLTPAVRNTNVVQILDNSDSETENFLPNTISSPKTLKRLPLKTLR